MRGASARPCWIQGGEEDWLIEHIASAPAFRGRGLIQALLASAIAAGHAAGFGNATITFVIGNDMAECCYAKAGFSFAEEKRDAGFKALTGTPGYRLLLTGLLCDILAHMKVFWPGVVFSKAAFRDGACRRLRSRRMAAGNAVGGHRTLLNRQSFCAGLLKGIRNARGREIALDCARSASTRFTPFENRRSIS
jgi:hypothetical protein